MKCVNQAEISTCKCIRFLDFVAELSELDRRQSSIVVVVKTLDEMQRTILRVLELLAQNCDSLLETDVVLLASKAPTAGNIYIYIYIHCEP